MSLRIIDKNVYLNNTIISKKAFLEEDVVEVISIKEEYINDFYKLKNTDIKDNIEVYCDVDNYTLNLFKENEKTFITKSLEVLDEDESFSVENFNELILNKFPEVNGIEVYADEDSIEDSLNVLFSTQLEDSESIKEVNSKIDNAYSELLKKIF